LDLLLTLLGKFGQIEEVEPKRQKGSKKAVQAKKYSCNFPGCGKVFFPAKFFFDPFYRVSPIPATERNMNVLTTRTEKDSTAPNQAAPSPTALKPT
jgi:hypothetical protein